VQQAVSQLAIETLQKAVLPRSRPPCATSKPMAGHCG
jgi:hypothetical protein